MPPTLHICTLPVVYGMHQPEELFIMYLMNFSITRFIYEIFAIKRFWGSSSAYTFDSKSITIMNMISFIWYF